MYKTSVLALTVSPKADKIVLNNKEYEGKTYFAVNIPVGHYDLKVSKDGYKDWIMNLNAESENLYDYKDVKLFLSNPEISELTEQNKIDLVNSPESALVENAENDLFSNAYEIWIDGKLVTRFSEPISGVKWYSDMEHVIFAKNNSVYIMESTGFNCTELFQLENSTLGSRFVSGNRGRDIYFYNNDKYYRAKIRN